MCNKRIKIDQHKITLDKKKSIELLLLLEMVF